ncbi:hypothetical protein DHD32_10115 [Arenibacter sp. TNZ]|uniref:hypothetical protein n=1 Tax=Arenibacter TaxID=178469 RepID=UPI000CD3BA34|nr:MULTISPECIES: hypothetical protein [Arenibacter]MCM4171837.1 hypothetical protein [Arenibacter sp. TNZ]
MILVYLGSENCNKSGLYFDHSSSDAMELSNEECSVISIGVEKDIKVWQKAINNYVSDWVIKNNLNAVE